jgi:hypothetical protein
MIKAIIKSTMLDGTPKDATDVRKSIRELLMDSRTYPLRKAPEMSSTETQQVLAQVSALLAGLDSGQAATPGWAKKAASYKRKVIPYLTEGLLIYISGPTSTTGTASAKNTGTAAGEHSLQGSNSTLLGESASTSSKKDEKTTELQWLRRIYLASLLLLRTPQVLRTLVPLPNITPSTWTAPGYQILRCWAKMRLLSPKMLEPCLCSNPPGGKTKQKHHQKNTHTHTQHRALVSLLPKARHAGGADGSGGLIPNSVRRGPRSACRGESEGNTARYAHGCPNAFAVGLRLLLALSDGSQKTPVSPPALGP